MEAVVLSGTILQFVQYNSAWSLWLALGRYIILRMNILLHKIQVKKPTWSTSSSEESSEVWDWGESIKLDRATGLCMSRNGKASKSHSWCAHRRDSPAISACAASSLRDEILIAGNITTDELSWILRWVNRLTALSKSCHLAIRWVEPNDIAYEPQDVRISMSPDLYRDHRLQLRPERVAADTRHSSSEHESQSRRTASNRDNTPAIDLVCHRLTMKWEPLFNIIHRYLCCRCIVRQSTPSRGRDWRCV